MKVNKWTASLAALGLISIPATSSAEEQLNQMWTALSSTTISGYVNTSIHWNLGTGNSSVPGYAFNSGKQDGFNLDVAKIAIAKPLDESQWSAGYNVELIYGQDARSLGTTLDSGGDSSATAIKQAYVALRSPVGNGLDAKIGVFDTPIGYETFDAHKNPNYTRSYGYTIEPTTHTGVLLSYQLCKFASASAGVANTFGPKIDERAPNESYKTYMGSLTLTAPDDWGFVSGSSLSGCVINGFNSGTASGGANQTSLYVGATMNTPWKWLKMGASYDYLGTTDHTYGSAPDTSWYANAFALYASMTVNEKLSVHVRGEYADTDTALLGSDPNLSGGNSKVVAATATVQYDLWKNVLSRLEFRWDHLAGDAQQTNYGGTPNSGGGSSTGSLQNYYTIALNIIYKF